MLRGELDGQLIRQAFEARPEGEEPWTALCAAMHNVKDAAQESGEEMLKVFTMVHQTPSLRARRIEKHLQWQALLTPEVRRRLGPTLPTPWMYGRRLSWRAC